MNYPNAFKTFESCRTFLSKHHSKAKNFLKQLSKQSIKLVISIVTLMCFLATNISAFSPSEMSNAHCISDYLAALEERSRNVLIEEMSNANSLGFLLREAFIEGRGESIDKAEEKTFRLLRNRITPGRHVAAPHEFNTIKEVIGKVFSLLKGKPLSVKVARERIFNFYAEAMQTRASSLGNASAKTISLVDGRKVVVNEELVLEFIKNILNQNPLHELRRCLSVERGAFTARGLNEIIIFIQEKSNSGSKKGEALSVFGIFMEADERFVNDENYAIIRNFLESDELNVTSGAIDALRGVIKSKRRYATEENLRLVVNVLHNEGAEAARIAYEDCAVKEAALKVFSEYVKISRAFIPQILENVIRLCADNDDSVRSSALRVLKEVVEADNIYATEDIISKAFETLSVHKGWSYFAAIDLLDASLLANRGLCTETNLNKVKHLLSHEKADIRAGAMRIIHRFIEVEPKFATRELMLELLEVFFDRRESYRVMEGAVAVLSLMLKNNSEILRDDEFKKVLSTLMRRDKYILPDDYRVYGLLSIMSVFIEYRHEYVTADVLQASLRWIDERKPHIREAALRLLCVLIKIHPAHLDPKACLGKLGTLIKKPSKGNSARQMDALKALSVLMKIKPEYADDEALMKIKESILSENTELRLVAINTYKEFIDVRNEKADEENLMEIINLLLIFNQEIREAVIGMIYKFSKINERAFSSDNFEKVLKLCIHDEPYVQVGALTVLRAFMKINAEFANDSGLKIALQCVGSENIEVVVGGLKTLGCIIEAGARYIKKSNLWAALFLLTDVSDRVREAAKETLGKIVYVARRFKKDDQWDVTQYLERLVDEDEKDMGFRDAVNATLGAVRITRRGHEERISAKKACERIREKSEESSDGAVLNEVLEKLSVENDSVKRSAVNELGVLVDRNGEFATKENYRYVLNMFSHKGVQREALSTMLKFLARNHRLADEESLEKVLKMQEESPYVVGVVGGDAPFLGIDRIGKINRKAFTEKLLKKVCQRFLSHSRRVRETANKTISRFAEYNPAAFTNDNFDELFRLYNKIMSLSIYLHNRTELHGAFSTFAAVGGKQADIKHVKCAMTLLADVSGSEIKNVAGSIRTLVSSQKDKFSDIKDIMERIYSFSEQGKRWFKEHALKLLAYIPYDSRYLERGNELCDAFKRLEDKTSIEEWDSISIALRDVDSVYYGKSVPRKRGNLRDVSPERGIARIIKILGKCPVGKIPVSLRKLNDELKNLFETEGIKEDDEGIDASSLGGVATKLEEAEEIFHQIVREIISILDEIIAEEADSKPHESTDFANIANTSVAIVATPKALELAASPEEIEEALFGAARLELYITVKNDAEKESALAFLNRSEAVSAYLHETIKPRIHFVKGDTPQKACVEATGRLLGREKGRAKSGHEVQDKIGLLFTSEDEQITEILTRGTGINCYKARGDFENTVNYGLLTGAVYNMITGKIVSGMEVSDGIVTLAPISVHELAKVLTLEKLAESAKLSAA